MEHARDGGRAWRADLRTWLDCELGHTTFDPVPASDRILTRLGVQNRLHLLKRTDPERYASIVRMLVRRDLRVLSQQCDYVICYWDRASARGAGTQGEVTLARFLRKPVYVVAGMSSDRIPGWITGCATRVLPSFTALRKLLRTKYPSRKENRHGK